MQDQIFLPIMNIHTGLIVFFFTSSFAAFPKGPNLASIIEKKMMLLFDKDNVKDLGCKYKYLSVFEYNFIALD